MTLIVEDGSNVPNSNTYADLATVRAYALDRGVVLSAVDSELEPLVFKSMDYLESFRSNYKGAKTSDDQSLQFPREGVYIDNVLIDDDVIPQTLIDSECQSVMAINDGYDLFTVVEGGFIKMEKVDVIETEYSETVGTRNQTYFPMINASLNPLLKATYLTTIRV